MTTPMRIPSKIAEAIDTTMTSMEWSAAFLDHDKRVLMLVQALCEELHPLGDFSVPSVRSLNAWLDRDDRNERIRAGFDGRNYKALARRHGLSERQVRRIIDGPKKKPRK